MRRLEIVPYRRIVGFDRLYLLPSVILFPMVDYPTTNPEIELHVWSIDFRFLFGGFTINFRKLVKT